MVARNFITVPGEAFTASGAGAVERTVESKLQDVVSVLDFIPTGEHAAIQAKTGSYNATTAIQAAFDYAAQVNKPVYFPTGEYLVSEIQVGTSISFFGDGRSNTRIRSLDDTLNLFTYEMAYADRYPFFIRDLTLFGGKYQLLAHNCIPADIRNCNFLRPTEACIRGGWNAYHWTVEGCEFRGGRYNIMFAGTGKGATANENVALDGGATSGISGQLNSLIGNWYVEAQQAAIRLDTAEGLNIIGGYLELCASDSTGGNSEWAASTAFNVGDVVNLNTTGVESYGHVYRCTEAGTTGTSAPSLTTEGASVTDGTVTWEVLGRRAGILVTHNRGFRVTHMQGERNDGTPWVYIDNDQDKPSTWFYSTIIANNSFRQTFPAPAIVLNNENRAIITGNQFVSTAAWLSVPNTSTVEGLIATGNIYDADMSVTGTLNDYTLSNNIKQNSSDEFTIVTNYTPGYNQAVDRFIEAQYLGNPNTLETKTYILDATFDSSTLGYVGTYEIQVGRYVSGSSVYGLSTYELNVTKGPNGLATVFTKIAGSLNVTFVVATDPDTGTPINTATAYRGGFSVGADNGVLIRVIRKTPLTNSANLTTLTHTIV